MINSVISKSPRDTKYHGICKARNRYVAHVRADDRVFYLGSFGSEVQAARAWDAALFWLQDYIATKSTKVKGPFSLSVPRFHDYNFPDEISESNPPIIDARLREIMSELRVVIPDGAPTETPFVDIFHEVMGAWFEDNKAATSWTGTTTDLHVLFRYAVSGLTVRKLGALLNGLHGIKRHRSNGRSLVVIYRGGVVGTQKAQKAKLDGPTYRVVLLRFKRLYRHQTPEAFHDLMTAFEKWKAGAEQILCPPAPSDAVSNQGATDSTERQPISLPVMCSEAKSVIVANESTCASAQSAPGLQQ